MKARDSKALREVWEWKNQAYKEVEGLDIDSALRKRLEGCMKTTRRLGIAVKRPATRQPS